MIVLTLVGTKEEFENLSLVMGNFDKDTLPKISKINLSEKQLKDFLTFKSEHYDIKLMRLNGQGDYTSITPFNNICTVVINGVNYLFGGISEKFYDKMVAEFVK
jgi:hypothetical protein